MAVEGKPTTGRTEDSGFNEEMPRKKRIARRVVRKLIAVSPL